VPNDRGETWTSYEICLDGTPVSLWNDKHNRHNEWIWSEFDPLPDAERVVFTALGLTELEYQGFVATEEARRACLQVDNRNEIPVPTLELVEVDCLFD
jgi:hypothetical protein